jgi:MerR family redox-sensitive transcriptional activator SoxR
MHTTDLLTMAETCRRSGFTASALRYYEDLGLVRAERSPSGWRRYPRSVLRRLAFIRAATSVGLSLDEVSQALASLPSSRTPTKADWVRISETWKSRLEERIDALVTLRDGLDSCIGCGCLSLQTCPLSNPGDLAGSTGIPGAAYLPAFLNAAAGPGNRSLATRKR